MTDHAEHHHTLSYADAITQYRADKDAYFRTGAGSPIPAADRASFAGLAYFPVDEAWIAGRPRAGAVRRRRAGPLRDPHDGRSSATGGAGGVFRFGLRVRTTR